MPTYANNFRLVAFAAAVLAALTLWVAQPAQAQMANLKDALGEMSIGSPNAPITVYEYSSLTCPHCARFHTETLPEIKKKYVDTGKVRFVFNDFPLGQLAAGAMMIVRCSEPERQVEFFDMLYHTQEKWSRAQNPMSALVSLARFYGLGENDVSQCLNNQELLQTIQNNAQSAANLYGIHSTPTFIVEGEKIEGAMSVKGFSQVLDDALELKGVR